MAIAYRSAGALDSADGVDLDFVPGLPTGWQEFDIFIAVIAGRANQPITVPGGWTIFNETSNASTLRTTLAWHRAGSSESAPTFSFPGGSLTTIGKIVAFSGCIRTGNPIGAVAAQANASSVTCTAPTITPPTNREAIVFASAGANDSTSSTYSGTNPVLTEVVDENVALTRKVALYVAWGLQELATATGARTSTLSVATANNGGLFSLIPGLEGQENSEAISRATLAGAGALAARSIGCSSARGTLTATAVCAGRSSGAARASGTSAGGGALAGRSSCAARVRGAMVGAGVLAGIALGSSFGLNDKFLIGQVIGASRSSAQLVGTGALSARSQGEASASTAPNGVGRLAGQLISAAIVRGEVLAAVALSAKSFGEAVAWAHAVGTGRIAGSAWAESYCHFDQNRQGYQDYTLPTLPPPLTQLKPHYVVYGINGEDRKSGSPTFGQQGWIVDFRSAADPTVSVWPADPVRPSIAVPGTDWALQYAFIQGPNGADQLHPTVVGFSGDHTNWLAGQSSSTNHELKFGDNGPNKSGIWHANGVHFMALVGVAHEPAGEARDYAFNGSRNWLTGAKTLPANPAVIAKINIQAGPGGTSDLCFDNFAIQGNIVETAMILTNQQVFTPAGTNGSTSRGYGLLTARNLKLWQSGHWDWVPERGLVNRSKWGVRSHGMAQWHFEDVEWLDAAKYGDDAGGTHEHFLYLSAIQGYCAVIHCRARSTVLTFFQLAGRHVDDAVLKAGSTYGPFPPTDPSGHAYSWGIVILRDNLALNCGTVWSCGNEQAAGTAGAGTPDDFYWGDNAFQFNVTNHLGTVMAENNHFYGGSSSPNRWAGGRIGPRGEFLDQDYLSMYVPEFVFTPPPDNWFNGYVRESGPSVDPRFPTVHYPKRGPYTIDVNGKVNSIPANSPSGTPTTGYYYPHDTQGPIFFHTDNKVYQLNEHHFTQGQAPAFLARGYSLRRVQSGKPLSRIPYINGPFDPQHPATPTAPGFFNKLWYNHPLKWTFRYTALVPDGVGALPQVNDFVVGSISGGTNPYPPDNKAHYSSVGRIKSIDTVGKKIVCDTLYQLHAVPGGNAQTSPCTFPLGGGPAVPVMTKTPADGEDLEVSIAATGSKTGAKATGITLVSIDGDNLGNVISPNQGGDNREQPPGPPNYPSVASYNFSNPPNALYNWPGTFDVNQNLTGTVLPAVSPSGEPFTEYDQQGYSSVLKAEIRGNVWDLQFANGACMSFSNCREVNIYEDGFDPVLGPTKASAKSPGRSFVNFAPASDAENLYPSGGSQLPFVVGPVGQQSTVDWQQAWFHSSSSTPTNKPSLWVGVQVGANRIAWRNNFTIPASVYDTWLFGGAPTGALFGISRNSSSARSAPMQGQAAARGRAVSPATVRATSSSVLAIAGRSSAAASPRALAGGTAAMFARAVAEARVRSRPTNAPNILDLAGESRGSSSTSAALDAPLSLFGRSVADARARLNLFARLAGQGYTVADGEGTHATAKAGGALAGVATAGAIARAISPVFVAIAGRSESSARVRGISAIFLPLSGRALGGGLARAVPPIFGQLFARSRGASSSSALLGGTAGLAGRALGSAHTSSEPFIRQGRVHGDSQCRGTMEAALAVSGTAYGVARSLYLTELSLPLVHSEGKLSRRSFTRAELGSLQPGRSRWDKF